MSAQPQQDRKRWLAVAMPLFVVCVFFGANVTRNAGATILWSLALVVLILGINLVVNPQLFRRKR